MKGVVLAGGTGTRLLPVTRVINKHLIPVNNSPMIFYAIDTLYDNGLTDMAIVLGGETIGELVSIITECRPYINPTYKYQRTPRGIADAISLVEDLVDDNFVVILGDNIFNKIDFRRQLKDFSKSDKVGFIFLKEVEHQNEYGNPLIERGRIVKVVEKPQTPLSIYAITGLYFYKKEVFDIIKKLTPSKRNELEISEVNNILATSNDLDYTIIDCDWLDCGTLGGLRKAWCLPNQNRYKLKRCEK